MDCFCVHHLGYRSLLIFCEPSRDRTNLSIALQGGFLVFKDILLPFSSEVKSDKSDSTYINKNSYTGLTKSHFNVRYYDKMSTSKINLGIDFGTNNTVFAFQDKNGIRVAQHFNQTEVGCRSCLFFPENKGGAEFSIGKQAMDDYLSSVHGGGAGRRILSIKALLFDEALDSVSIYNTDWSPTEMAGVFLKKLKDDYESKYWTKNSKATVCRPVILSTNPSCDKYLEKRLRMAMEFAGYDQIEIIPEPIAALLNIKTGLKPGSKVLVADFGAGTSDFCIVQIPNNPEDIKAMCASVLATSGIGIGGDKFTQNLFLEYMTPHLGKNALHKSSLESFNTTPIHIYHQLVDWYGLWKLKSAARMETLRRIISNSKTPADKLELLRLKRVIVENLSYEMLESVEIAKKELSESKATNIQYHRTGYPEISINDSLTERMLDEVVHTEIRKIDGTINQALKQADVSQEDVDLVFMTGGTSLATPIRNLLEHKFPNRVVMNNLFTAVAEGASQYSTIS